MSSSGKLIRVPPVFTTLIFGAGHAALPPTQVPRFHQDPLGYVHIEGTSQVTAPIATNAVLFTNALPAAMRPLNARAIQQQSLADLEVFVLTDGTLTASGGFTAGEVLCFDFSFMPIV